LRAADLRRDVRAGPDLFAAVNVELIVIIEIVEELVRALARIFHFGPELADASAAHDDFYARRLANLCRSS